MASSSSSDELLELAKEMSSQIEVKTRKHRFRTLHDTFHGSQAITWLTAKYDCTR